MLIAIACFVLYGISSAILVIEMLREGPNKKLLTSISAVVAIILHIILLKNGVFYEHNLEGEQGQNLSMLNVASLIAWLITVTMFVSSFKLANNILLPVVYCFSGLIVMADSLFPYAHIIQVNLQPHLLIHVSLALLAYACLSIAFLYAIQLTYINIRLKQKKISFSQSPLPPLMVVENILFKLLVVGTILLSLSLLSGFLFLDDLFAKEQAHKTLLSIIAWLIYSVIVVGHWLFGWRGKLVVSSSIVSCAILTLGYFGSRFVREVLLNA